MARNKDSVINDVYGCPTCDRLFDSLDDFDKHRQGRIPNIHCVNPLDIKMYVKYGVMRDRVIDVWAA